MTTLILDPASAVAVGKCLVTRLWKPGVGTLDVSALHPRPCAWEDFTRDELARMLGDFNHEADYDARWERYRNPIVERFHALPRTEQARLVRLAQYPEGV